MAASMKESGKKTRLMDRVFIPIPIELSILVVGLMISNMAMELKSGLTVLSTLVNTNTVRSMAKESLSSLMEVSMKAISLIT